MSIMKVIFILLQELRDGGEQAGGHANMLPDSSQ
jgi:hypothetical protein